MKTACARFFTALMPEEADYFFMEDNGEASYLADLKDHRIFKAFLGELSTYGRNGYLTLVDGGAPGHRDLTRYESWNKTLSKQLQRLESLNMNPGLLLESLYKEMASVS